MMNPVTHSAMPQISHPSRFQSRIPGFVPACTIAVLACLLPMVARAEPSRKPNVILIMTDDQGYGDIARPRQSDHQDAEHGPAPLGERASDRFPRRSDLLAHAGRADDRALLHPHRCLAHHQRPLDDASGRADPGRGLQGERLCHRDDRQVAPRRQLSRAARRTRDSTTPSGITVVASETARISGATITSTTRYMVNGTRQKFEGYCTDVWFREATRYRRAAPRQAVFPLPRPQRAARTVLCSGPLCRPLRGRRHAGNNGEILRHDRQHR